MSVPIQFGKGVNKDLLPSELPPGVWSDMLNFRSRNRVDEKFEGARAVTAPSVEVRYLNDYETAAGVRWVIEGGKNQAYAWDGSAARNEITRYTDGVAIASITRVGTTATMTTTGNHGRTTADVVSVYGASPSQYNATGAITVTGATTYTYVMASDPGASASPVGAYTYNVTQNFGTGYVSGGLLNSVQIVNYSANGTYYWSGDTSIPLRKFPQSNICDVARPFLYHIFQLAPTENGVKDPYKVIWSNAAEQGTIPSSFTPTDTNDASFNLVDADNGPLVDCLPMGDANIIYQQRGRVAARYIGGNDVFSFTKLPGNDGLFAMNCVVDTPKGHVFLSQTRDVMIHQGGQAVSIAEGRVKEYLARSMHASGPAPIVFSNPSKTEVWIGFASSNLNSYPPLFLVWNWESDTWGYFALGRTISFAKAGAWPSGLTNVTFPSGSSTTPKNAVVMTGTDSLIGGAPYMAVMEPVGGGLFCGSAVTGTLERTGMDMGDRDTFKTPQRARWNFDGTAGDTATSYLGTSKTADGTTTWTAGTTYTIGTTDYADGRATSGRFVGVKLSTTAGPISVRSVDLDVTGGGKR